MLKPVLERLVMVLARHLLSASFALTVGGLLLGCLEITMLSVSDGLVGGVIALIGLIGMMVSLPIHHRAVRWPPRAWL